VVERIWRRKGLKVPQKQPKKGRLWLHDGSCVRLRPERRNHVWSYDFVQDRTHDGRVFRTLNIIDALPYQRLQANAGRDFTKEALAIKVKHRLNSTDVVDALTDLFILRGLPEFKRSDNGAEFLAKKVRAWIGAVGAKTAFIAPGSPWENGYCESFNSGFRSFHGLHANRERATEELLNGEVFYTLREAQILIERGAGKHDADRPEAHHVLTLKLDHPTGALQTHRPI
jgi:putative transposase